MHVVSKEWTQVTSQQSLITLFVSKYGDRPQHYQETILKLYPKAKLCQLSLKDQVQSPAETIYGSRCECRLTDLDIE